MIALRSLYRRFKTQQKEFLKFHGRKKGEKVLSNASIQF